MQSVDSNNMKNKISVLPSMNSILVGCVLLSGHIVHNIPNAYSVEGEASSGIDMTCVSKFGSAFPFCLPDATDHLNGIDNMDPAAVLACLGLSLVVLHLKMQSLSGIGKKDQNSVLPNPHSSLLICAVFCAHAAHNLRKTYGVQGPAGQSGVDNACVVKSGSIFPFCLPDAYNAGHSASISKVFPAVILGFLALIFVAAQNLMQSYNSIDKKDQNSVLPKFHSLVLVCIIFCAHVVHNMWNATGIPGTASLRATIDMDLSDGMIQILAMVIIAIAIAVAVVVHIVVQQSSRVGKKGKNSVLPNVYSVVIICGIFCTHFAHIYSVQGPTAQYMISAFPFEGIAEMLPNIGFLLLSLVGVALLMRSDSANKTTKVSVLPNLCSVMLICCVLGMHAVHNWPENTNIASPDARVGTILGASSTIQRFGHKEHGGNIPANVLDSITENGVGAGSTGISKTSPKAIFASVLFAFIGMTLKMGDNSNDKKGKKSVLPNSRSILLICCVLCGHVVHNWPGIYSEYSSQASVYTGVDEVASWDESGSVLPDTAEDLDNLLEVSPDLFDQPSDMLTSR